MTTTVLYPAVILKAWASRPSLLASSLSAISFPNPDLHPSCTCPSRGANSTSHSCLGLGSSYLPTQSALQSLCTFLRSFPLPCLRKHSAKKGRTPIVFIKKKKKKKKKIMGGEKDSTRLVLIPAPWQVVHILNNPKPTCTLYPNILYNPTHQHKTQTHLSNVQYFHHEKKVKEKDHLTPCGGSEKLAFKKPHRGRRRSYRKCLGVEERR